MLRSGEWGVRFRKIRVICFCRNGFTNSD